MTLISGSLEGIIAYSDAAKYAIYKSILSGYILYMDYIHQTIHSDSLLGIFNVPASLRNKKVEVLVFPAGDKAVPIDTVNGSVPSENSAFGCLKKYADPAKIAGEKGAWERAVVEKHAKD